MPATGSASVQFFISLGNKLMGNAVGMSAGTIMYRFRALFGITPDIVGCLWDLLHKNELIVAGAEPLHLLWALLFLKCYATEPVNSVITGADEKTFRTWVWRYVNILSNLNVIQWNERHSNHALSNCFASVDGTDFRIREPWPFDKKWYSHKFKGPGLRYEIRVAVGNGRIVWANGPFPCGKYSDLKIFQRDMKHALEDNEVVIADGGYTDERCVKYWECLERSRFYAVVRARHETVNRRFKQFSVLGNRFRHSLAKHSMCFHAVCNVVEVAIENGQPLFNIST